MVEAWNAGDELISSCECGWVEVHGCQDTTLPAYLGVDLVELYNQWKLSSATYETYTPEYGLDNITYPLGDYIVKFLTEDIEMRFQKTLTNTCQSTVVSVALVSPLNTAILISFGTRIA